MMTRSAGLIAAVIGLFAIALPAPCFGSVTRSADPFPDHSIIGAIEFAGDYGLDVPLTPHKPHDIDLVILQGGAYIQVTALGNYSANAESIAHALDAATNGTPLAGSAVTWSQGFYAGAQLTRTRSHVGLMFSRTTLPLQGLVAALRRDGYNPAVLLRVPRYTSAPGLPPTFCSTSHNSYYDNHLLGSRPLISLWAKMPWTIPVAWILMISLPAIAAITGFLTVRLRARRDPHFPLKGRPFFTFLTVFVPMQALIAGLIAAHASFAADYDRVLEDLWFGMPFRPDFALITYGIQAVSGILAIYISGQWRRRLFPVRKANPAELLLTPEEAKLRKSMDSRQQAVHATVTLLAVASPFLAFLLPGASRFGSFAHLVAPWLGLSLGALATRPLRKRLKSLTTKVIDGDLTWRARQLAQHLGVRVHEVWVESGSWADRAASASRKGSDIFLSRKLVDTFTPAEIDFVLAHEIACIRLSVPSGSGFGQIKRKQEADRQALEVTGSRTAASSALDKLMADADKLEIAGPRPADVARAVAAAQAARTRLLERQIALPQL